ncbi:MAG: hypothetical protein IH611_13335 [Deltaproteobacteria bacterium]|nr:hypothetical protein [Deltaproteobacteria bacterium]
MTANFPRGVRAAGWFLPLVLIAAAAIISQGLVSRGPSRGTNVNPPTVLAALSHRPSLAFGFRNLLADVAWLQAVQASGNRKMTRGDYDRFSDLLGTVTRFDPRFMVPYLAGGLVLGESRAHAAKAIELLEAGEKRFFLEWRFPFYVGYIYYFVVGDPSKGGEAIMRASRTPGSPAYFPLLASRMLSEGYRPETALVFLKEMVEQESDLQRRAMLEERIRLIAVERDLQVLEKAVADYRSRFGVFPGRIPDLVRAGVLGRIPEEPYGGEYVLSADGRVRSSRAPEERLKVLRTR